MLTANQVVNWDGGWLKSRNQSLPGRTFGSDSILQERQTETNRSALHIQ